MDNVLVASVTDRLNMLKNSATCTHNGLLKTSHAGRCDNTGSRRDYIICGDTNPENQKTVSNIDSTKRHRHTSMPNVPSKQGNCNIVNTAGKVTSRRTTLISKTKYHYVKMTGGDFDQESLLVEEIYPRFINKSKSSESIAMDSEDSCCSSQSSGIYDKRLSIVSGLSHSDYETCGSQTSLDDYENDRFSVCSAGLKDDHSFSSNSNKFSQPDGQNSRPLSSVLGDSELDELDYSEVEDTATRPEEDRRRDERTSSPEPERPAILDQGMTATMAWLRSELMELRKMDQSLIGQFMNIQGKIRSLKTQQQQRYKQTVIMRKQLLAGEHTSALIGNHRFSWELDSLYEEDEYYDYDTEDDSDEDGACGYS